VVRISLTPLHSALPINSTFGAGVQVRPKSQRKPMTASLRWKKSVGQSVQHVPTALSASILPKGSGQGGPQDNEMNDGTERAGNTRTTTPDKQTNASRYRESFHSNGDDVENGAGDSSDDDDDSFDQRMQFTVTSIKKRENCAEKMFGFLTPNVDENVYKPNRLFCRYINWTFRAGFLMVFLTFLVIFMMLTLAFGGFLEIAGKRHPECIVVAGEPFGTNPNTTLADAYGLSWTTVR